MKKAPCAFVKNEPGFVTPQPAIDWFAAGLGLAQRKWDGVPCLIAPDPDGSGAYVFYRGVRLTADEPTPLRFHQTSDAGDPEIRGWVPVSGQDEADLSYKIAITNLGLANRPIEPGTYELCGPGIKGNPEGFEHLTLVKHGLVCFIRCPRSLEGVIQFMALQTHPFEGIVWKHGDQYCQLTRADVGLKWPA